MIPAACAQESIVPGDGADALVMPAQTPDQFVLNRVPNLQFTGVGAHTKETAIAAPLDAGDSVLRAKVAELGYTAI